MFDESKSRDSAMASLFIHRTQAPRCTTQSCRVILSFVCGCIPPSLQAHIRHWHAMPRAESQHRQQHISTTGWATSALQTLRWIVPLALVALYVSAVMTPPQRHTELVAVAAAERNDVLPWDQHEFARDWVVGSLVYEKPVAGWTTAMAPNDTASATSDSANLASSWTHSVESYVDRIGDFLMLLLGLDDDEDDSTLSGTQSSGLNTWAESSIYVEVTIFSPSMQSYAC